MTLAEGKKTVLNLLQEYNGSATSPYTDDTDINNSLNYMFNIAQHELARIKPIRKSSKLDRSSIGTTELYREYDLPTDMWQLEQVVLKNSTTKEIITDEKLDFYIENEHIYINDLSLGDYVIKYFAYPTEITSTTEDTVNFDIDQDAQLVLPFAVASEILRGDITNDNYARFERRYNELLSRLDTRKSKGIITISSNESLNSFDNF